MATQTDYPLAPVQFSRLAKRGILLGLSLPQLIVLGTALLTVVVSLYTAGAKGLAFASPVWGTLALLAVVPVGGRKVIEWLPIVTRWATRTLGGQLRFRRNIIRPRPAGTLALPGDMAALREWEDPETGAAMIHDPHNQTLTAILSVTHPAFVLLDPGEQQRRAEDDQLWQGKAEQNPALRQPGELDGCQRVVGLGCHDLLLPRWRCAWWRR
jgi:hypothetical protein